MTIAKEGLSKNKKLMHYSIGAVIKKGNKFLLIERNIPPEGFACVAGHIDGGENEIEALKREVFEESGLKIKKHKLILEEEIEWNWCVKGAKSHYWYVFECSVDGRIKKNLSETKSIGWYSQLEIKKLKLEPVWEYFFKKLKIIN